MVTTCRYSGFCPVASICANIASQTVGTPAEWVTFSSFINVHSTAGSLTAENTNLIPAAAPANGRPQAAAWNIGTTGKATDCGESENTAGCISASAWITVERCSYNTPLGFPVVPEV